MVYFCGSAPQNYAIILLTVCFFDDLENLYKQFLFVGGMPKVVQSWFDTKEVEKVDEIQKEILMSYENDFAKYAPISYFPKLYSFWNFKEWVNNLSPNCII